MISDFPPPASRNGRSGVSPVSFATPLDDAAAPAPSDADGPSSSHRSSRPAASASASTASSPAVRHPLDDPSSLRSDVPRQPRRRGRRSSGFGVSRSTPDLSRPTPRRQPRPPSGSDAKRQQTKQLPRSVRWRLSLGLLTRPTAGGSGGKEKLLKSIEDLNALKLRCQRSRYDDLEKKHYWRSTPVSIADETNGAPAGDPLGGSGHEGMHHVAPGDDPLSSALLPEAKPKGKPGADEKRRFGFRRDKMSSWKIGDPNKGSLSKSFGDSTKGSLTKSFGDSTKGSLTKSNGSLLGDSFTSVNSSLNSESDHSNCVSGGGGGGGDEAACKGSRWADFYSTREVLDVIEKDLVRLPANHYTIYHEWRIKNIEWKEDREKVEKWGLDQLRKELGKDDDTILSSDGTIHKEKQPVGEPVEQQLGQPLNESNKWKIGQSFNFGLLNRARSTENLSILLNADEDVDEEQKRDEIARAEVQNSIKERAGRISQILFVYAREHPEIGYRQGMHEVLSYILLALEMDLLELHITQDRNSWRESSTSFGLPKNKDQGEVTRGGMAGVDASGNLVVVRLIDQNYILHDAFNLFEHIMTSLAPAYDAIPLEDDTAQSMLEEAKTERDESPMESMTSNIVSKIRFVARDEQLFGHILYMPVPPQLYFAKWIRLMFGRELAGGMKNVLRLWDAFFELANARVSNQEDLPVTVALLDVLKTASASMILLIRHKILAPTMAPDGTMTGEPDPNLGIGYLMNYPPVEDIGTLVEMISKLLKREQKLSTQCKVMKEKELERSYQNLSLQNHPISSIDEHPLEAKERMIENWRSKAAPTSNANDPLTPHIKEGGNNGHNTSMFLQQIHDLCMEKNSQGQPQPPPNRNHNVAESLGNMLVDFGSKTASAAIASIQNKVALDHPLQQFNDAATSKENRDEEIVIKYRPYAPVSSPKQKTANVVQLPIGEKLQLNATIGENNPEHNFVERLFDAEEQEGSDSATDEDLDASMLSVSRSIGDSLQKSPKEMASILEKSVDTLMRHFNEQMVSRTDLAEDDGSLLGIGSSLNSNANCHVSSKNIIPDEIWDAMAEIDRVRKELLHQDALTAMDHARSCSSLRSSSSKVAARRGNRGTTSQMRE